jgi:hypothetical protein
LAKNELEYLRGLSKALTLQTQSLNMRIAELEAAAAPVIDTSSIRTYADAIAAYLSTATDPPRKVSQSGIVGVACASLGIDRSKLRAPLSVAEWAALGEVIIAHGYLPDGVSDARYVRRK